MTQSRREAEDKASVTPTLRVAQFYDYSKSQRSTFQNSDHCVVITPLYDVIILVREDVIALIPLPS